MVPGKESDPLFLTSNRRGEMVSIISVSALKRGLVGGVLPRDGSIEKGEGGKEEGSRERPES